MERTRRVARRLAKEGVLAVTQKGRVLGADEPYKGPIRLRWASH